MMDVQGKSDLPIVPLKPSNDAALAAAETGEGRGGAKGNAIQSGMRQTQSWESVSLALDRIRDAARRDRREKFTALLHHVTIELLHYAALQLKRRAAPGVDGITWEAYEADLESNLRDLHGRIHRGGYRAKPSRRQYIPKSDGRQRPLGIAALEDKIVQRAVAEVLNAIYETDFLGFSYGFRPGRSQHDALDALATGIYRQKVNFVVDADIRSFFDSMDHSWLMRFLEHRIADRRLLRLIGKWLKAGVLEEGRLLTPDKGTPQGAVISPLLANIYLHYVYDLWAQQWRQQHAQGDVIVCAMPTTWWWASSSSTMLGASSPISGRDWSASGCNCMPRRLGPSSSAATPQRTAKPVGSSLRPSTSWGSRVSAGPTGKEGSSSGGTRRASGYKPSCTRSKT